MTDIGSIAGAVAIIAAPVGGAIAWLWNKIEKRISRVEANQEACEARSAVQLTVIELLWLEIRRHAPASPVIERVRELLEEIKAKGGRTPEL